MENLLLLVFLSVSVCISLDPNIVTVITEESKKISKFKLKSAFTVTRHKNGSDSLVYILKNSGLMWPTFTTGNTEQEGKRLIVLNHDESGLDECAGDNVHVVLILNGKEAVNSTYKVLYAYRRSNGKIEWENYSPRGGTVTNKAFYFGHEHCTRSLLTSCKKERPKKNFGNRLMDTRITRNETNDYVCDILNVNSQVHISGAILATMNIAERASEGSKIINDEIANKGNKTLEEERRAVFTGMFVYYSLLGGIGQIAEQIIYKDKTTNGDFWETLYNPKFEEKRTNTRKHIGLQFLFGLCKGNSKPNKPKADTLIHLLSKSIAEIVVFEGPESEISKDKAVVTNSTDYLMKSILAKIGETKSAAKIFLENVKTGLYVPYSLVEKTDNNNINTISKEEIKDILAPLGRGRLTQLFSGIVKKLNGHAIGVPSCDGICGLKQIMMSVIKDLNEENKIDNQGISRIPLKMETEVDLFGEWGWLSRGISVQNLSVEIEDSNFIGLGKTSLEMRKTNNGEFDKIDSKQNYVKFLMRLLNLDHRTRLGYRINQLVNDGYLTYDNKNKIFVIEEVSSILEDKNLSTEEEIYICLIFELVAFSKTYKSLADSSLISKCPSGQKISKSVAILQIMAMEYINSVYQYGNVHLVKLIRNFGLTMKTFFVKSLQDVYRYNSCKKCSPKQISLADNNAFTLYGLFQFVSLRSWKIDSWTPSADASDKFPVINITNYYNSDVSENRDQIISDVSKYII